MEGYVHRGLEKAILEAVDFPVLIVEGRRAVGKSTLANQLVGQAKAPYGAMVSLLDGQELARAQADPLNWLEDLPDTCIIDEAQLLEDIAKYVKIIVDDLSRPRRFLLTGSARIGTMRAEGTDWLAGRSIRFELPVLGEAELISTRPGGPRNLVDELFSGTWDSHWEKTGGLTLEQTLAFGGLPGVALRRPKLSERSLRQLHLSELRAALTPAPVGVQRFDAGVAARVLDALLLIPGGLLSMARIADQLGIDVRTVSRYLDLLRERFLLRLLPNLAGSAAGMARRAPKVHASDTYNVCVALAMAGHHVAADRAVRGQVLETWVHNQIVAAQDWAGLATEVFFWREPKSNSEVDLVVVDGSGRLVAIEVKAARRLNATDYRAFQALAAAQEKQGQHFHRGFVIYGGDQIRQLQRNVWALPWWALGLPQ